MAGLTLVSLPLTGPLMVRLAVDSTVWFLLHRTSIAENVDGGIKPLLGGMVNEQSLSLFESLCDAPSSLYHRCHRWVDEVIGIHTVDAQPGLR